MKMKILISFLIIINVALIISDARTHWIVLLIPNPWALLVSIGLRITLVILLIWYLFYLDDDEL